MRTIRDEDRRSSSNERDPIVFKDAKCVARTSAAVFVIIGGEDAVWVQESFLPNDNEINAVGDGGKLVVKAYGVSEKYNSALYAVAERLGFVD